MYQLKHNKETFEMIIAPMTVMGAKYLEDGKVTYYNENYYICNDRKQLREFAKILHQRWIEELEIKLEKARAMTIKNKYK